MTTHKVEAVRAALYAIVVEFNDYHYNGCAADNATGRCNCFAGSLLRRARAALAEDRPDSAATEQEAAEQMDNGRNTGGKSYHRAEPTELQQLFDLQWEADQMAVRLWREANPGNDLVMPDRCNLVVWLLNKFATTEDRPDREGVGAPTDEMIQAFCVASDSNGIGCEKGSFLWEQTEKGLRAALAATPDTALKEAGEAVAWRIWGGQEWIYSDYEPGITHRHVEPLYAHPPRSSALPADDAVRLALQRARVFIVEKTHIRDSREAERIIAEIDSALTRAADDRTGAREGGGHD